MIIRLNLQERREDSEGTDCPFPSLRSSRNNVLIYLSKDVFEYLTPRMLLLLFLYENLMDR